MTYQHTRTKKLILAKAHCIGRASPWMLKCLVASNQDQTTKPIETPVDPLRGLRLLLLASSGFTPSFTAAFQQGLQTAHEHFGQLWLFPIQPGQRIYKKSTLEICLLTERKDVKDLYLFLQRHKCTIRILILIYKLTWLYIITIWIVYRIDIRYYLLEYYNVKRIVYIYIDIYICAYKSVIVHAFQRMSMHNHVYVCIYTRPIVAI